MGRFYFFNKPAGVKRLSTPRHLLSGTRVTQLLTININVSFGVSVLFIKPLAGREKETHRQTDRQRETDRHNEIYKKLFIYTPQINYVDLVYRVVGTIKIPITPQRIKTNLSTL